MHPALWISKTGLDAQQTKISTISNNLANAGTIGFKRMRVNFESLLYQKVQQPGADSSSTTELPTGLMLGTGVRVAGTQRLFESGSMQTTDNPSDMAINGNGFFQVTMPDSTTSYTRDGQFHVGSDGRLVTSNGYALTPNVTVPSGARSLTIGSDGTVSIVTSAGSTSTLASITIADFINPAGLEPLGNNLYKETVASGSPTVAAPNSSGLGALQQGALEGSNVNVVEELVGLIETQRAYEMNSKGIETVDGMLQFVAQTL